jgi:hypothetical protein
MIIYFVQVVTAQVPCEFQIVVVAKVKTILNTK